MHLRPQITLAGNVVSFLCISFRKSHVLYSLMILLLSSKKIEAVFSPREDVAKTKIQETI